MAVSKANPMTQPKVAHDLHEVESLSQWQLIRERFARHRLAMASLWVLIVLAIVALGCEFFAPTTSNWRNPAYTYCPPQLPVFTMKDGLHTKVVVRHTDPVSFERSYHYDLVEGKTIPLGFFVEGEPYRLFGLIPGKTHFFGVDRAEWQVADPDLQAPPWYLLGADRYGHDLFSRIIYGARISLFIGIVAIGITFFLGVSIGGVSGYFGGHTDIVIQRAIEIINGFPQLPLWLALAAAMPGDWSPLTTYFAITIVLSLLGWTGLARQVRGKILALREEDYVTAARLMGARHGRILFRHLVPGFTSHIIVSLTLAVPAMILGETALSFLGLGLRPPIVSWGVLLQDCMSMQTVGSYPWLLMPVMPIVITVLAYNFLGDGLRDAADPYATPLTGNYSIKPAARPRYIFRLATKIPGAAFGLLLCCYFGGLLFRGDLRAPIPVHTPEELAAYAAARDVSFDPDKPLTVHREVDYSEGPEAAWWPKGQSPVLDRPVAEGKLPPVHVRTGPEPAVLAGVDGTGTYGGTWYRVANSIRDVRLIGGRMAGSTLLRWSPLGYPVLPHAAKAFEQSADGREFTIYLRRGMRWSDGHPVTAHDFEFYFNSRYIWWDKLPDWMHVGVERQPGTIRVVDDFTIRFNFPQPHGVFLERLCLMSQGLPRHYLADYHPKTGDPVKIEREMAKRGHTEAIGLYSELMAWNNPECPRTWPWIYRTHTATPPYTFVRNPYFWAVDTEGNQLPYIDQVQIDVKSNEMIAFAAATGELTFQARYIRPQDYTLLMLGREGHDYDIYHWYPSFTSNYAVFPNMNRRIEPGDPVTRNKHAVLNDLRFRQALSLAIDRATIIETEYYGLTEPAQIDPGPISPFHYPKLRNAFIEYDPDRANALLDDMGLTSRDREGYRAFADGTRMQFYINTCEWTGPGPAQFLIDDWRAVGIRVVLRDRARRLFFSEQRTLSHDLSVWTSSSEYIPLLSPRVFVPYAGSSIFASRYGVWYNLGGLADPNSQRIKESQIALEPPVDSPFRRSQMLYSQALATADREEQIAIMHEVFDIAAENLWAISICTSPPQPIVVSKRLRNVPRNAIAGSFFLTPANAGIETFYLVDDDNDDQTRDAITRSMTEVRSRLENGGLSPTFGAILGTVIKWLIIGSVAAFLILMAVRHPFVARRLVIMVPTLLIISVVSFIIIQLPPSDFLTMRIMHLRMAGDEAAVEEAQQMAALFHVEENSFQHYLRWMGLHWFLSFNSADAGLLQGSLGLSMEDGKPVNEKVGDRVLLTALISLFGILVTWVLALPIGIYSAVRQYSIPDYIFTLLGFLGMSVPPFLVALVLMYLADAWFGVAASGLFSPEYAGKPWSWARFIDLMQHIWLPVLVLGLGGTAGMIRVMRGNLLDELGKPYVTTARAKGIRSPKLLLKYPVRVALNPFISTIGGIFPSLVSGGAIVAIVLSLPTVGPQMLNSLMTEDMYFAGSMLMVLSLLGIFGTLVSDLLLLWLDPRIRMEAGGSR